VFQQSFQPVFSRIFIDRLIDTMGNAPTDPLIDDGVLRLYTAVTEPISPQSEVADFTEATFSGYAEVAVDTSLAPNPVNYPTEAGRGFDVQGNFIADNAITPPGETILGYYVVEKTGGEVIVCAEEFAEPVPIVNFGDFLDLSVILGAMFTQNVQEVP